MTINENEDPCYSPSLFLLSLLVSVFAVLTGSCHVPPVNQQVSSSDSNQSRSSLDLHPKAAEFVAWLKNHRTYDKICFYSGSTSNVAIWTKMDGLQMNFGRQWIGSLLKLAGITQEDTKDWTNPVEWAEVSKTLAENARRDVVVILGEMYDRTAGVWNTIELPTLRDLKSRGLVLSIRSYIMKDGAGKLEGPFEVN